MRPSVAALAVLAVVLAGCVGAGPLPHDGQALAAADDTGLPAGVPTRVRHFPCVEQFAYLPIPMQVARDAVPDGFAPLSFEPTGQLAMTVAVGFTCEHTEGDQGFALGELRTLGLVLAVTPPEAYLAEGIQYYVVPLGGLTSSPEMGTVYSAWDFGPVHLAPLDFEVADTVGLARHGRVAGDVAGFGMELTTASVGPVHPGAANAFRVFGLRDGNVTGAVDWSWPAGADAMENGTAALRLSGDLSGAFAPVEPGLGYQYWGAYEYQLQHVELAAVP